MHEPAASSELDDRRKKRRRSVNWGGLLPVFLSLLVLVVLAATPVVEKESGPGNVQPALRALAQERPQETVAVIVQKAGKTAVEGLVERLGGAVTRDLSFINGFVAELPAGSVPALAAADGVRHVSLDAPMVSAQAPEPETLAVRDEFNAIAYDNDDGSAPWETAWQEVGEAQDPERDFVRVGWSLRCAAGTCLRLGDYEPYSYFVNERGVLREADLSEARSAVLRFEFARRGRWHWRSSFSVALSVSADGGATWTELTAYELDERDWETIPQEFDITPYATADTQIRFAASGYVHAESTDYFYVDNVEIAYSTLPDSVYARSVGADQLWQRPSPIDGQQVTVAVVDSGIANHGDLGADADGTSRVAAEVDLLHDNPVAEDLYGHGTHIAGIIAGNDQTLDAGYEGMAPRATIVDVKAINEAGAGTVSDVVEGLHWIYEHKDEYNIRVVNLSLNSTLPESYNDSPLTAALEILWFNDVVVVVSAGNNGTSASGELYPPANDPYAIVVGATDDGGTPGVDDDLVTSYSAYGVTAEGIAKPDLVAPGNNIISLLAGDASNLALNHPENVVLSQAEGGYFSMSGTSLSSAVVSGAVAQLLQAEPELTPDQVKHRLMHTARTDWAGYDPLRAGAGYLDVGAAVDSSTTERANENAIPHTLLAKMALIAYWANANPDEVIDWSTVNWASVNWASVNWASVNWASVNWASVNWDEVKWDEIDWTSVNWASVNWASVNWASVNWASVNWASVNWASVNWASVYWDN